MTLVQAWIDSLSLLKPKNLKLFLLVTLKSVTDTYKILLKYWWWLFGIIIGCFVVSYLRDDSVMGIRNFSVQDGLLVIDYSWTEKLSAWVYQVLLFATIVATRSSLEQKDCTYFRRYMIYFLLIVPLLFIVPLKFWPTSMSPLYFFALLFFLDSPKRLLYLQKINGHRACDLLFSVIRALKMIIYNFPLLLCIGLAIRILEDTFGYLFISPLLVSGVPLFRIFRIFHIIGVALLPVSVCLYTNIYIKKLHDQFDLYFKQPS
jgi:hypothetical protein